MEPEGSKGSNVLQIKVAQDPFRRNLSSLSKYVELKKAEQRGWTDWLSKWTSGCLRLGLRSKSVKISLFWSRSSQLQGAGGHCEPHQQGAS